MRAFSVLPLLLVACNGEKDEDDDHSGPPIVQDTDVPEQNAPVVEAVHFDTCVYDFPDEGPLPAVLVTADGSDIDGDLHYISLKLWWDTTVDGAVDVSGAENTGTTPYHVQDDTRGYLEDGEASEVSMGVWLNVALTEGDGVLLFATEYEFAVEVIDFDELASEPMIATFTTPADGLYDPC